MPRDLRSTMQYTVRVLKGKDIKEVAKIHFRYQILLSNFGNRLCCWGGAVVLLHQEEKASLVHRSLILH